MRPSLAAVPLVALATCAQPADRPVRMGVSVSVPEITLDRLDDQLHLRVFPKADLSCHADVGQIFQGTTRTTDAYPGHNVNPTVRCDPSAWAQQMAMFGGVAMPVDLCFSKSSPQSVQVPAGTYIVLVEGSGAVTGAGGTMPHILLGSGCTEVTTTAGSTQMLTIEMREQADVGVCGDMMVQGNESCDDGMPDDACDNKCQFPERQANTTTVGPPSPHNPSVAWAASQPLLVAFEAGDDVVLDDVDPTGALITSPPNLANDNVLDATPRFEQHDVRLAATATGFAAAWDSNEFTISDFDIEGTFGLYGSFPPPPSDIVIPPTSMQSGHSRSHPAIAVNGTTAAWAFQDDTSMSIRVAGSTVGTTLTAPTADAPVAASGPSASMASAPSLVAFGSGYAAAWSAGPLGGTDVYAVLLGANGQPMGTPIVANSTTGGNQDQPTLAAMGTDLVVAFRDDSHVDPADTSGTTVRFRHFDATLTPTASDQVVPSTTDGDQITPTIAISASGVVLVAWENVNDGTIRGRLLHTDGSTVVNRVTATDSDFAVNAAADEMPTGTGPRHLPSAAWGGAQRFAVAWQDDGLMQIRVRTLRGD